MNEQEKIAEDIFSKYGLDFKMATRAGGWTNAVWLNGDLALRVSFHKESDRIRREVRLSEFLPNRIGYPVNIEVGTRDGYEWSLSKRIYGHNLSDNWNNLDFRKRVLTIGQILQVIEELHKVNISDVEDMSNKHAWYSSFNARETYSCLTKYKHQNIFTSEQIDVLYDTLECFWAMHHSITHVLNHGDITMDNLLWSNGRIISLLDFEHSVIAPSELDLHSLINLAFFSNEDDLLRNRNINEYKQYEADVIVLLKPILANNYSAKLILGYAILFRMRFLEFWLGNPEGNIEDVDAYIKLRSLANGEGGYLTEIIYS